MKKASTLFFIAVFSALLLGSCNSAARKAKKCDCPTFGSTLQQSAITPKDS